MLADEVFFSFDCLVHKGGLKPQSFHLHDDWRWTNVTGVCHVHPPGSRRCCDVESASLTLIQCRNNIVSGLRGALGALAPPGWDIEGPLGPPEGQGPPPRPIFAKFFEKSPKLAKMYPKILGGKLPNPSAPPYLQILDPPLILQPLVDSIMTVLISGTLTEHIESPGMT